MKYDANYEPPAPVVKLTVYRPFSEESVTGIGKIDSGADMTVIPNKWAKGLSLIPASVVWVRGYDGRLREAYTYYARIEFQGFKFPLVEILLSNRQDALIGRDILNKLKVELNGKTLDFELFDP
ncbi:MAG: hypothetical protein JTT17_04965 [Candidatus Brockarchaeota archaeon]|nr:hypothetical protein [Candidatus Brockarchaeota archaeon]